MMAEDRKGAVLTDHNLIEATHASRIDQYVRDHKRVYTATFESATSGAIITRTFAVGHAEAAAVYAREYAVRILPRGADGAQPGPYRVLSVRWAR